MRTQFTLVLALVVVLIAGLLGCGGKQGRTVAIVNGQPLTRDQFHETLEVTYGRQGLIIAVLDTLVKQEAKKQNISVTDKEIEAQLDEMAKPYGGREVLLQRLKESGIGEQDWHAQIESELMTEKLATKGVTVTDAEIKDFFEKNRPQFDQPAMVKLHVITTDSQQKADEAYKRLMSGADFAAVAREFSTDATTKARGGETGWRSADTLRPAELATQAFALRVGQLSKPLRVDSRYTILRVDDRKEAKPASLDEVKDLIRRELAMRKGENISTLRERLLGGADVEVLWPRYKPLETELRALKSRAAAGALPVLEAQPAPAPQQGGPSKQAPARKTRPTKR